MTAAVTLRALRYRDTRQGQCNIARILVICILHRTHLGWHTQGWVWAEIRNEETTWKHYTKWLLRNRTRVSGLDSSRAGQGPVQTSFENGNRTSDSIKGGDSLWSRRNNQRLYNGCAPWRELTGFITEQVYLMCEQRQEEKIMNNETEYWRLFNVAVPTAVNTMRWSRSVEKYEWWVRKKSERQRSAFRSWD
jgi:hypothetical protein